MIKHLDITVSGRVQAVGFRYHTKQIASQLGIKGTVQNQADGTVQIEAEGTRRQLQRLLDWCKQGPDAANVAAVEAYSGEPIGYRSFEIT